LGVELLIALSVFALACIVAIVRTVEQLPSRPSRRRSSDRDGPRGKVRKVRVEPGVVVGRRPGIKVKAEVQVDGAKYKVLEYRVRFRHPNGVPVMAHASRYYGPGGELVARARTRPLANDPARYPDLWLFLPYTAFELAGGVHELEVQFDLELEGRWFAGGKVMSHLDLPAQAAIAAPASAVEFAIVATGTDQAALCPVCSVAVTEDPHPCPRCETIHHLDCWEYNEGCTTYGCAGAD
jgi:hypothetical protein